MAMRPRHVTFRPLVYVPTETLRRKVRAMAAVGVKHEHIALSIQCDPKTLRKHYREELDQAATEANAQVAGRLFKLAMDGDVAACIFWTKARMGWSEKVDVRHSMSDGTSLEDRLAQLEADPDRDANAIEGEASEISEQGREMVPVRAGK